MKSLQWKVGEVEILQIVEFEDAGELIQQSIPNATPENIKKVIGFTPILLIKMEILNQ